MTPHESTAWRLAGDLLLDDPREGDDWGLAREALALRILANLRAGRDPLANLSSSFFVQTLARSVMAP
jgi:hypothetical protein